MFKNIWRNAASRFFFRTGKVLDKMFDAERWFYPHPDKRPTDKVRIAPIFWLKLENAGKTRKISVTEAEWDSVEIGEQFPKEGK